ncbi:Inactivation-no-after-potential D protein, partial [Habropoda laboriosa]
STFFPGITELSMDKPESDEEEEHWKDASPITPTCSPTSKTLPTDKPPKTIEVDVHDFQPTSPLDEKDILIIDGSVTPPSKKMAMKYNQEIFTGVEKVAPKVKLKMEPVIESKELPDKVPEIARQPSSTIGKRPDSEKRRSLRRMDSEERMSSSKEVVNKADVVEKGARKKIFKKKDHDRRSFRRKIDESEETEQGCIERVTEFLSKHSALTYSDMAPDSEEEMTVQSPVEDKEQRIVRPSSLIEAHDVSSRGISEEESTVRAKRETLQRSEELVKTPSSIESEKYIVTPVRTTVTTLDKPPESAEEVKILVTGSETEAPVATKRRSSMRKRPGAFSRESSKESLLDDTKKEVRIQENVEEIFFEDTSEQISGILPEVQLVKARIITAEQAAANRVEEPARIEVHSPPEVVMVSDSVRVKTGRVPSPETINVSQLQLLSLAKSTSENTLMDTGDHISEENKISQRNIKAEILLDLSKVTDVGEEADVTDGEKIDRKLSRTGSEGSKRSRLKGQTKLKEHDGFKIGSLAQPDEPELTILLETAVIERRRNVDDDRDSLVDYEIDKEIKSDSEHLGFAEEPERPRDPEAGSRLVADQEVELPSRKVLEALPRDDRKRLHRDEEREEPEGIPETRDYDRTLWEQRRPLLEETVLFRSEEDSSLISKEHSLEYQSQTLESQPSAEHLLLSTSLENLLKSGPDNWSSEQLDRSVEEAERSFKETQYSPKEKRDAETQTEQETKSTQCSPEQSIVSPSEIYKHSPLHLARKLYQSPRREVQTQTQGESKSVQCCLDDLGSLSRTSNFEDSFDSPSRSEKSYVKESKSIQCIPGDLSTSPDKSNDSVAQLSDQERPYRSTKREVEVQTYQESKAIQCSDDELLEAQGSSQLQAAKRTESSGSSGCASPTKLPTLVFVDAERADMTVTHRDHDGNMSWSKHWGPERLVEIFREPKTSLGLSIVGGKVDLHNGSSSKSQNISGIFIKNVLPNSPAGRTGELKIGDRIIEVDGVDLRHSTHERAVEVIQAAGNPVRLLVQSLVHLNNEHGGDGEEGGRSGRRQSVRSRLPGTPTASFRQKPSPISPVRSSTPDVTQGGLEDGDRQSSSRSDFRRQSTRASDGAGSSVRRSSMKKSVRKKAPSPPSNPGILREVSEEKEDNASKPEEPPRRKYSSDESSEEDTRDLEGNVYTKAGMEISRKSAGNVKRSKAEIEADPEQEDEFGYTKMKVQKKYQALGHKVLMVKLEKDRRGLGISLAGHRDRNRMAVFVCGLNPKGAAHKTGELVVGDEILEVNGCVLQGRCHLNASAKIKGMAGTCFKIIVLRRTAALNDIAVKPIAQFPPTLEDGQYGLGIMIIEGKHAEVGQGIFISDIQEGSAAEQAGLQVGDMILAVNMDCLLGSTYDEATSLLKKAEGVVTLTVCNPNQSKVAKEEEDRAKGIIPEPEPVAPKEPEKPKEPEPPQDPKDCKIVAGRDTAIEFQKDKDKGIGFTIAGGSDTPLKGVFIVEVFPDGSAGKDGRLQAGDQILEMCTHKFKDMEHDQVHAAVLKASGTITMLVFRQEKGEEEIEVEIQKKSGKGAGLCLTGYKSGKGAYVSDLLPGGSALESGKICKGDRVVAVGGQDVREAPVEDIAVHLKVSNPVQLKLARFKSSKQ